MSEEAGKHTHEMFQPLSTRQNGSGQEHSSSSSLSSELIHSKGDQPTTPLLLPRSELLDENGCTNTSAVNNSSLEDETATLQTQMNSTLENDTAAQDLFPPLTLCPSNQGGDMSLNLNLGEEESTEGQLHDGPPQTLFGFDLSLTPSPIADTNMGGEVDLQLPTNHHAQQEQQQQPSSSFIGLNVRNNVGYGSAAPPLLSDHLSLDSLSFRHRLSDQRQQNSLAFGNNGIVISQLNASSSRPQEIPLFAQAMQPTEFYATNGVSSSQFHLLPDNPLQHDHMQMIRPEIINPPSDHYSQHQWSPVHGLQLPSHRIPPASASSRRLYPTSSLYDPVYESMELPADPFLRMFLSNPNFANRRRN